MLQVGLGEAAQTAALRRRVLRPALDPDGPDLPYPPNALHIAALDADLVVGACVLFPAPCPWRPGAAWQLRAMAVEPAHQGRGVGALVLAEVFRHADLVWCHARETAIGFYARHGFTGHGDLFVHAETGLPHLAMARIPQNDCR